MGAQYTLNSNAEFREGELPDAFTQVTVYHWHFYAADRANTPTHLDATCLQIIFAPRPRFIALWFDVTLCGRPTAIESVLIDVLSQFANDYTVDTIFEAFITRLQEKMCRPFKYSTNVLKFVVLISDCHPLSTPSNAVWKLTFSNSLSTSLPCCPPSDCQRLWFSTTTECARVINPCIIIIITRGQSNLTKSASRGAHSPVMGHPRGSKVVPLNSWGRVSY